MITTLTGLSPFEVFAVIAAIMIIVNVFAMDRARKQKDDEKKFSERQMALREKELAIRERELKLREAEAERRRNLRLAK